MTLIVLGCRCKFVVRHRSVPYRLMQVISKADFISTVVTFDTNSLSNHVIKTVEDVFKASGDLNAETVTRASKACGPLYQVRPSMGRNSRLDRVRATVR